MSSYGKPVWSHDQIARQLTHDFWHSMGHSSQSFAIRSGGTLTVDVSQVNATDRAIAREALQTWTEMSGIQFREVSYGAQIRFDDENDGAYASTSGWGGRITQAEVNIKAGWSTDAYRFQVYLHEIGHALGLGHAGNYDGARAKAEGRSITYGDDAMYANDTWLTTVMSYFHPGLAPSVDATPSNLETPMVADLIAITNLYGTPVGVQAGNTTYGDGAHGAEWMKLSAVRTRTLVDSGGQDVIDLRSRSDDQRLDLNPESYSDLDGRKNVLAIARGTVIEDARLGGGDDTVAGNGAANRIDGGAGDDKITGGGGGDAIIGGAGNDTLEGGSGRDAAVFDAASGGFSASLAGQALTVRGAGTDTLTGFETLRFTDRSLDVGDVRDALAGLGGSAGFDRIIEAIEGGGGSAASASAPVPAPAPAPVPAPAQAAPPVAPEPPAPTPPAPPPVAPPPVDPAPAGAVTGRMEVGAVEVHARSSMHDDRWVRVSFDGKIENAVVILETAYRGRDATPLMEVRNVTDHGFEVRSAEYLHQNQYHPKITYSWMAGTAGAHELDDGTEIMFGRTALSGRDAVQIDFEGFSQTPGFYGTLVGESDDRAVHRARWLDRNDVTVRLDVEEAERDGLDAVSRDFNWVAVAAADGSDIGQTRVTTGDVGAVVAYDRTLQHFADLQTTNGPDTATARFTGGPNGETRVHVAEERSGDAETVHVGETIAVLSLESGRRELYADGASASAGFDFADPSAHGPDCGCGDCGDGGHAHDGHDHQRGHQHGHQHGHRHGHHDGHGPSGGCGCDACRDAEDGLPEGHFHGDGHDHGGHGHSHAIPDYGSLIGFA